MTLNISPPLSRVAALLVSVLVIFACMEEVSCSYCAPGSFFEKQGWGGCFGCDPGNYCPGDDHSYPCPVGKVAPNSGSVSCSACPNGYNTDPFHIKCSPCSSGRMSPDETFCLLPNTPFNAVPFVGNVLTIGAKQTYSYVEVSFVDIEESDRSMNQLTLTSKDRSNLLVYASSVTGSPNPQNFEYNGYGQNVTLAIKGKANTVSLMYLNITVVDNPDRFPFTLSSTFYNMIIDKVQKVEDGDNLITLNTNFEGEVILQYANTNARADIQFTISVAGYYMFYHVFYSSNQLIQYPNPNNADFVYYGDARANPQVQVNALNRGPGFVNVAIQSKYGNGDTIKVNVKNLKH